MYLLDCPLDGVLRLRDGTLINHRRSGRGAFRLGEQRAPDDSHRIAHNEEGRLSAAVSALIVLAVSFMHLSQHENSEASFGR